MKKWLKAVAFVVALLAFALFVINPAYIKPSSSTARQIAESYMKKQTSVQQYEVTAAEFWYDDAHIQLMYNVKPTENGKEKWINNENEISEDGWVRGKTAFIRYYKIGNFYFTGLSLKFKLPTQFA